MRLKDILLEAPEDEELSDTPLEDIEGEESDDKQLMGRSELDDIMSDDSLELGGSEDFDDQLWDSLKTHSYVSDYSHDEQSPSNPINLITKSTNDLARIISDLKIDNGKDLAAAQQDGKSGLYNNETHKFRLSQSQFISSIIKFRKDKK